MDDIVSQSTARQDFNALLMTIFGAVAVLLAAVGIYGLMAYSVERRTREIGIRLALGAESGRVKNMLILQGMRLVWMGVGIGIVAAFALSRLLSGFLFGVQARPCRVLARSRCSHCARLLRRLAAGPPCQHGRPDKRASA